MWCFFFEFVVRGIAVNSYSAQVASVKFVQLRRLKNFVLINVVGSFLPAIASQVIAKLYRPEIAW